MLARHVPDLTGPSSGTFYKLYLQVWYVLLDTSSRYEIKFKLILVLQGFEVFDSGRGVQMSCDPLASTDKHRVSIQSSYDVTPRLLVSTYPFFEEWLMPCYEGVKQSKKSLLDPEEINQILLKIDTSPDLSISWSYHPRGHAVAQLVEALRYKSEDRGFDSRWCHWNFSLT